MRTRLIGAALLLSICSITAQTATTVKQQIATDLADNNTQKISPAVIRGTLNGIVDFVNTKVSGDYVIVSPTGNSIKLKPSGTSIPKAATPIELFHEFQSVAEVATIYTYKGKPVFLKKTRLEITNPSTIILTGFDQLYEMEGRAIWTDANGYEQTATMGNYYINTSTKEVSVYDFDCDGGTAKRYEIVMMYTKQ
ncbi:MAG: hypothetical protein V4585_05325 [Bacteroidota bacterium]